jgi:hypothetical protein
MVICEKRRNMKRGEVLDKAKVTVSGDREQDYGSPEKNFERIAGMWSAYLGLKVEQKDVAAMMALLKIARIASGHAKDDNWIDLAGYAACGGEIESESTNPTTTTIKAGLSYTDVNVFDGDLR